MAQTTTVIFLLAILVIAATTVSGQEPPSPPANCAAGLAVCLPALSQGGTPSLECCTAVDNAIKTQLSCFCGFIKRPMLLVSFNVTAFNAVLSTTCGLNTDPNLCSETAAQPPVPLTTAPIPKTPEANKNASTKLAGTGFVGIVLIMLTAMFYYI